MWAVSGFGRKVRLLVLDPAVAQKISEEKIVDVAQANKRPCLEESGQWLENVNQTPLILASGKLVLQKR